MMIKTLALERVPCEGCFMGNYRAYTEVQVLYAFQSETPLKLYGETHLKLSYGDTIITVGGKTMEQVNNTATSTTASITTQGVTAPQAEPQGFDYDKLASILDGKLKATEDSVLKGYAKQQGLTGDEMSQAIEAFKKEKASRTPSIESLNGQITDLQDALLEAQADALYAQANMEAFGMASELGVEAKTIPYLMKLADLSDVVNEGQINTDKLKESLGEVLKEIPQLKISHEEKSTGFKIGADNPRQKSSTDEELARIFGVNKKVEKGL